MKKILILLVVGVTMLSCRKDIPVTAPGLEKLFGKWEWISSSGGIAGITITPASQGTSQTLEFDPKGKYKRTENGKKILKTRYGFTTETLSSGQTVNYIYYESTRQARQIIFFAGDTLVLKDECSDCYRNLYIRN